MADMDTYDAEPRGYEDERDYPPARDRSRSPGGDRDRDRDGDVRLRDDATNGRADRDPPARKGGDDGDISTNPGSNLFVTGINPRLSEDELSRLFEKYGQVEHCSIMRDPHTRESRGFGFVKMVTSEEADTAKEELQGQTYEGRTLSIEKARRARPRTPTPGKYFGPPKRDERPPRPGGYRDRYDDRGSSRRDDRRGGGGGGYRDRYDDRSYGRRDEYRSSGRDRDDRYGDRRGGGGGGGGGSYGGGYERSSRGPPPEAGGYGDSAARDPPSRSYDERPRRYD